MDLIIENPQDLVDITIMASKTSPDDSPQRGFKYPYYPLDSALKIAAAVKDLGGARSPVKRSLLAKQLGAVENSAAFAQSITSAKTFGVIDGHGDCALTEVSKRYFFPTNESDKSVALLDIFSAPSAFGELLKRFDGDRIPSKEILSNILHRDLGIPESWKDRVAALFTNSAQSVGVIDSQGILRVNATRHSVSGDPEQAIKKPGSTTEQTPSEKEPLRTAPGKVHWRFKSIEVLTPEDLDRDLWEKLEGYVKLLEPSE